MSEARDTSEQGPDAVAEIRSWCRDAHPVAPGPDDCLFCYAAAVVERHRTEIYDLARLAIEGSERDVHLYVGRLAHRHQRDGLGSRLFGLPITFGPVVRADESDESVVNVVARHRRELTQAELAERAGVEPPAPRFDGMADGARRGGLADRSRPDGVDDLGAALVDHHRSVRGSHRRGDRDGAPAR